MTAPVPSLHCPFPPAVGDHAEALDAHAAEWMADNRLYASEAKLARYQASRFGTFAALTCPHPEVPLELMKLYTEWLAFGFFYDDCFMDESTAPDRAAAVAEAVIAMVAAFTPQGVVVAPVYVDSGGEHRLPIVRDLLERTAAVARPEQFERLRTHMLLWWYSYLHEPLARTSRRPVAIPAYCVNRVYNIASVPYVTVTQIVAACSATAQELAHPEAVRMGYLAAGQMAWCNDIHSADNEMKVNPDIAHLPGLLTASRMDEARAMSEAVRIHDATMRAYLETEKKALTSGLPGLADYSRVLRAWIRGHYDWSRGSARYNTPFADGACS